MTKKLQLGDVVCLKSGSTRMTVEGQRTDASGQPEVVCHWYQDGTLQEAVFHVDELDEVPKDEK